jgi:hypothetical protein
MACLIAAPCSGSGKTLLTLALTALLRQRGRSVQTFKVGPDYLDPQLLSRVSGRPCRNLDRLLCGSSWVERSFHWWGRQADHCLVEGVMGLFDGRGPGDEGSSAELAAALQLPVELAGEPEGEEEGGASMGSSRSRSRCRSASAAHSAQVPSRLWSSWAGSRPRCRDGRLRPGWRGSRPSTGMPMAARASLSSAWCRAVLTPLSTTPAMVRSER